MKRFYMIIIIVLLGAQIDLFAQDGGVSIGKGDVDADPSAILELVSTNKGLLIPRLSSDQREGINSPATGLLVFDTTLAGFYYWTGNSWDAISGINSASGTSLPESAEEGDLFYDTIESVLYTYIESVWKSVGSNEQILSLDNTILKLLEEGKVNGSEVDLSVLFQELSLEGTKLSITDGNSVDLGIITDPAQTLSLDGTILTITNGNSVDFSSLLSGTMLTAVYDTNADNVVDSASVAGSAGNAATVNSLTVETAVPVSAIFTDNQTAAEVTYDNTTSGLTATDVKAAIDEVAAASSDDQTATEVSVTASGNLTSTTVQTALEELQADIDAGGVGGNMLQSTYDIDANSKVDEADNAATVNDLTVQTAVPVGAVFTDDQTLSEVLSSGTSAGNNQITNLGTPTATTDAATKGYVDSSVSGLESQSNKNIAGGYVGLETDGKINQNYLPAGVNLGTVYTVASQTEQDALTATGGDVAVRTDLSKTYVYDGSIWVELQNPTDAVTSVAGQTGVVTLAGMGLDQVDNTSDIDKPVSTAVQTALDAKANTTDLGTAAVLDSGTGANNVVQLDATGKLPAVDGSALTNLPSAPVTSVAGQTGDVTLTGSDVGLGNVDNTSDVDKPVSTATQSALDLKEDKTNKNIAGGYVGLETDGKINQNYLPAGVNLGTVYTVASEAEQDALTAGSGDVAVRTDESRTYVYDGSSWVELQNPTGAVTSVNGQTGTVVLSTAEVAASADKNYLTDAELTVIGNTSGTNTGDQDISGIATNATDIATNATDISANTAAIATNTTDISAKANSADLGTAAALNVGTAANEVVQLDATGKLPAVDGSQLTGLSSAPVSTVAGRIGDVTLTTADVAASTDANYVTDAELTVIGNTSGTNTGDQDISGIATNATDIATNATDISANTAAIATNTTDISAKANSADLGTAAALNVGTAANEVVQLDATGKLPAVDGSQLTGLSSAPVSTVAGRIGDVTLTTADVAASTDANYVTDAELTVIGNTSGTNTGDQDISGIATNSTDIATNATDISTNTAAISTNTTDIAAKANIADLGTAAALNVGTAANEVVQLDATGKLPAVDGSQLTGLSSAPVSTVAGRIGDVTLTTADVAASTDANYVTDAQLTVIGNTSGTNTGDQDISGIGINATAIATTQTALDLKEDKSNKNIAGGYVGLETDGKINQNYLPAGVNLGTVYTVASQPEQDALTATGGDVAVRTDLSKTYVYDGSIWVELQNPTDAVTSVAGQTGVVSLSKSDVGLSNVDNTSDVDKPVSTAVQSALDTKANSTDLAAVATSGSYNDLAGTPTLGTASGLDAGTGANNVVQLDATGKLPAVDGSALTNLPSAPVTSVAGQTGDVTLTGSDVGLGNVDNTSDVDKPVSTATQLALDLKEDKTNKNIAGGYVGLETDGKINQNYLPAGVNLGTVYTVASQAEQDALTAGSGDVAVRTDESRTYVYDGSSWVELQNPTGAVTSVNGQTGTVVLSTAEVAASADKNYVTDAELIVIGNTSGTNTGDQDISGIATNATAIAANTAAIATNTTDIAAKANIADLGTAAALNVGTAANEVVQLDATGKLPAVDGSQLTGLSSAPVSTVAGRIGDVTLTTADVAASTDANYVTDAELTVIGNTSGTNTGDQTATDVAVTASGNLTSTTVQTALEELQADIDAGASGGDMLTTVYDTNADNVVDSAAVAGNADNATTVNGLTVETAVPVSADFTDDQTATEVSVTASGNLTSTTVQTALEELQADIDAGASGGDMLTTVYDTNADNVVDSAAVAGNATTVNGLTVETAVPVSADFTDDQTATEVTYDNTTSGLAATDVKAAIDEVAAASSDDQSAGEVAVTAAGNLTSTDVQSALVELQTDVDGKEDKSNKNIAGGYVGLETDGKINTNYLPAGINLSTVYTVADQTAQDALTPISGDVAIRTDESKTYVYDGSSWVELLNPTDAVTSVAGQTGVVTLAGMGLDQVDNTSDIDKPVSTAVQTALDAKANTTDLGTVAGLDVGTAANEVVQLDATGKLPAVDGSQLTGLPSAPVTSVAGLTGDVALTTANVSASTDANYVTDAQLTVIGNTSGTNTGDQAATEVAVTASGNLSSTDVQSALVELQTDVDGKEDKSNKNIAGGYVGLETDGKINTNYLPAGINLSTVYTVADQTAQDALTPISGDVAIRTDESKTYVYDGSSWVELLNPTDAVTSVAGQTGIVTLAGMGLDQVDNTSDIDKPVSTAVQTALDAKANTTDLGTVAGLDVGTAANEVVQLDATGKLPAVDGSQLTGLPSAPVTSVAGLTGDVTLTTANVSASTDANYVTDAQLTVIGNTSGTNTGDQTATDVAVTASGNLTSTTVQTALEELQADIDAGASGGDMLTTVYDTNADNVVDSAAVAGNATTINGLTVETAVPVSADFTDDQTATEVTYDNTTSGLAATDVKAAIDEVAAASSDDQTATEVSVTASGNLTSTTVQTALEELQADIDAGASGGDMLTTVYDTNADNVVDSAAVAGNATTVNGLTVETAVPVSADFTDDQTATEVTYDNTTSGLAATDVKAAIDEVAAASSDDQTSAEVTYDNTTSGLTATEVKSAIDELDATLDAGVLTDDQTSAEVTYDNTTSGLTATDVKAAIDEVAAASSDDQTSAEVTYDNTTSGLTATEVKSAIDELDATLDAGVLTDDQTSAEVTYDNTTSGLTATDVKAAIDEVAAASSDDQTSAEVTYDNTTSGLTATDVKAAIDEVAAASSDDQTSAEVTYDNTTSGLTATEVKSAIDELDATLDAGVLTDDQTSAEVTYDNTTSGLTATDVKAAIDEVAAASSDDQISAEVTYDNTTSGLTATEVKSAIDELDATLDAGVLTDDQTSAEVTYDNTTSGLTATDVKAAIDEVVAASSDDQTSAEVTYDNTTSGLTATDVKAAIDEVAAASSDDQTSAEVTYDNTTSGLTATEVKSAIDELDATLDAGVLTDDQTSAEVTYDNTTSGLTATDVKAAIDEVAAASSDDQTSAEVTYDNTTSGLTATEVKSAIDELDATLDAGVLTDDQTSAEVTYDNTTSGLTATDVKAAIDEVAAASSDDQTSAEVTYDNTTSGLTATEVKSAIDELDATLDAGVLTDDQTSAEVTYDNTTSGLTATDVKAAIDEVAAASSDDQTSAEVTYDNTTSGLTATEVKSAIDELDATLDAGVLTDDQTSAEVTYDNTTSGLTATDVKAAIDEVAAASSDDQTSAEVTYDNTTSGLTATEVKSAIDELDATLDAGVLTDDQTSAEVTYDNTTSGLTATDVKAAIDEVVAASSDDQTSAEVTYDNTTSGLTATDVKAAIDEVAAASSDDQTSAEVTYDNTTSGLTATEVKSAIDELDATLDAGVLTDDQTSAEVTYDNTTSGLTATDVKAAIDEVAAASSDDQTSAEVTYDNTTSGLTATEVKSAIDELDATLDAGVLTDDQTSAEVTYDNTTSGLTATDVKAAIDEVVAASSDDQTSAEVTYDNTTSGLTATEVKSAIDELDATLDAGVLTDDQTSAEVTYDNTTSGLTATDVKAAIDEVAAASSDDQTSAEVTYDNTTSGLTATEVKSAIDELDATLDAGVLTDDQTSAEVTYDNTTSGLTATDVKAAIDEVAAASSDDQTSAEVTYDNTTSGLTATEVKSAIDELDATLDAGVLTDDQTSAEVTYDNTTSGLTATDVKAAIDEVAAASSDDQTSAEVTYDNTTSGLTATEVKSAIDELDATLDAGVLTDDQTSAEVTYDNTTSGLTATDVKAAIDEVAAASSDDQTSAEVTYDNTTSGLTATEVKSAIDELDATLDAGVLTDDQTSAEVTYDNTTSGLAATDVKAAIDEVAAASSDDQTATEVSVTASGNLTSTTVQTALEELQADIDAGASGGDMLTTVYDTNADNVVDSAAVAGNATTVNGLTVETAVPVSADFTDDQTATEVTYDNTTSGLAATDVKAAIDEVAAASSDDQTSAEVTYDNTTSGLAATDVKAAIDEVAAASSDDQTATEVSVTASGNLTSTTVQTALEELQADIDAGASGGDMLTTVYDTNADNVVDSAAVAGNATTVNGLTVETAVPVSADFTDDQTATEVTYDNTTSGLAATDVKAAIDEVAAASSDDQTSAEVTYDNTTSGLTATEVKSAIDELDATLDAGVLTDDQTSAEVTYDNTTSGLAATDVKAAIDEVAAASSDDQTATEVSVTASGNLTSTTVQTALEELQADIDAGASGGDMLTTVYDTDADNMVDSAAVAESVIADAITATEIATDAVGSDEIAVDAVTTSEIADGTITAADLSDMSATSGQILSWDGTNWVASDASSGDMTTTVYDTDADNMVDSAAVAESVIADAITTTEIADGTITAADLSDMSATSGQVLSWDGTNWVASDASSGDMTTTVYDTDADNMVDSAAVAESVIADAITATEIATDAVGSDEIADGTITAADLSDMSATSGQVLSWDGTNWVASDAASGDMTTTVYDTDADNMVDSAAVAESVIADAITTTEIADGTITAADLSDMSATSGQVLSWDGTNWVASDASSGDMTTTVYDTDADNMVDSAAVAESVIADAITATEIATDAVGSDEIADGTITAADLSDMSATSGQVLSWDGTNWVASDAASGDMTTTVYDTDADNMVDSAAVAESVIADAITSTEIATDAVGSDEIAVDAVTTSEIADGTITAADLSDMSATSGQILSWDGTTWVASDAALGDMTKSVYDIDADNMADSAAVAESVIADAITTTEIADGTITAADLSDMSATSGQILSWDGTNWVASDAAIGDMTKSVYDTDADNMADSAAVAESVIADAITAAEIATGAVTADEILDGTITAADLSDMSATSGQILSWDGTTWVASDAALGDMTKSVYDIDADNMADSAAVAESVIADAITTTEIADGTITAADLSDMSATSGQILSWDGTNWVASDAALGDMTKSVYDIDADNMADSAAVAESVIADAITATEIATDAVGSDEIADGTITAADLSDMSATSGQILSWDGTNWVASDAAIGDMTKSVYDTDADNMVDSAAVAESVVDDGVTTTAILDGTIDDADISATAAIAGTKIDPDFGDQDVVIGAGSLSIGAGTPDSTLASEDAYITGNLEVDGTIITQAYTLPTVDGTAGQLLSANGDGTLTWTTPATGISGTTEGSTMSWDNTEGSWVESTTLINIEDTVQVTSNLKVGDPTPTYITVDGGDLVVADDAEIMGNLWVDGVLSSPSDERLKKNITTLTSVLDRLNKLRGVTFEYKDQQRFASGPQIGVIAQELQKVFPELVTKGTDGYLAVNYSQLSAVVLQAVKEQQQEIDLLKEQMKEVMKKLGME